VKPIPVKIATPHNHSYIRSRINGIADTMTAWNTAPQSI
jgi:hypothetical protein